MKRKHFAGGCVALGACMLAGGITWGCNGKGISITKQESVEASSAVVETMQETTEENAKETVVDSTEQSDKADAGKKVNNSDAASQKIESAVLKDKAIKVRYVDGSKDYKPSIPAYKVNADLSNVTNTDRYYLGEKQKAKLAQNGFVVRDSGISEFFEIYEDNRYDQLPNFITTDSMMHTYHLYFAMLLKNIEKTSLYDEVAHLAKKMQENSLAQYEVLKGSEWETAAYKNVVYFSIAATLMDLKVNIPDEVTKDVNEELAKIMAADQIDFSSIIDYPEDYSQYKPRGYYAGDEKLEKYFRTMMLFGHLNFQQTEEQMDRCALLMNLALSDQECYDAWFKIYEVTSFFAGESDDLGYPDYMPVIEEAYGKGCTLGQIIGNADAFTKYQQGITKLDGPQINSVIFEDDGSDEDKLPSGKGFRMMGQRFNLDGAIFEQLIYSKVDETADGLKRMLPDALDVPAALGSDLALDLLKEQGNDIYPNYLSQMQVAREMVSGMSDYWSSSLYGGWMFTLAPLLEEKKDGYPSFMTNSEWQKKSLENYLSSWTELKHDTILYAKQVVAEMGGGDDEEVYDDRGYVEPEPELYARLRTLSEATADGLDKLGYLSKGDKEGLERISELAGRLREISIKELQNQSLTDEDYQLIRDYGGDLEHLWLDTMRASHPDSDYFASEEYPIAMVADVATDPSGYCLEEALGDASVVYVVFPIDGELHIATGGVFTYYQFEQPISNRLTDQEWRIKMGLAVNDNGEFNTDEAIDQPEWTRSYRYNWREDEGE